MIFKVQQSGSLHKWKMRVSVKQNFRIGLIKQKFAGNRLFEIQRDGMKSSNYVIYSWKDFSYEGKRVDGQVLLKYVQYSEMIRIMHQDSGAKLQIQLEKLQLSDPQSKFRYVIGLQERGDQIQIINISPMRNRGIRERDDIARFLLRNDHLMDDSDFYEEKIIPKDQFQSISEISLESWDRKDDFNQSAQKIYRAFSFHQ